MILIEVANTCAAAPPGVESYAGLLISWIKWGVGALIVGAAFVSVGAMIVGKIGSMSRAAQGGATGLVWAVIAAIAYVVIYGVLTSIMGNC